MSRLMRYASIIFLTLFGLYLLWFFRYLSGILLASLAVAAALRPLINWMSQSRLQRASVITLVYAAMVASLLLICAVIIAVAWEELQVLASTWVVRYEALWSKEQLSSLEQVLVATLPAPATLYSSTTDENSIVNIGSIAIQLSAVVSGLAAAPLIFFISLYWSSGQDRFERLWLSLVPASARTQARLIWRKIELEIGTYIRSQAIQAAFVLGVLWPLYAVLQFPYPLLMALAPAIFYLIPLVGTLAGIGAVILFAAAYGTIGWLAVIVTVGLLLFVRFTLAPRLLPDWRYNALLVVLVTIALFQLAGVAGIVLAPLIAAVIQIIARAFLERRMESAEAETLMAQIVLLEARAELLRGRINDQQDEGDMRILDSLLNRLLVIIASAKQELTNIA